MTSSGISGSQRGERNDGTEPLPYRYQLVFPDLVEVRNIDSLVYLLRLFLFSRRSNRIAVITTTVV